ncbi:MAG: response regulator [Pontiellaceae bacterium]|nr:response regulator [Pontiellaceae bacterium]
MSYTSLLKRQIRKHLGSDFVPGPELEPFLRAVDLAYQDFKTDRELLEHALMLSSEELTEANEQLRSEGEVGRQVIERLRILGNGINNELGYTQFTALDGSTLLDEVEVLSAAFRQNQMAQEELRQAKNKADLIYRVVPSAVFTLDSERKITSWNRKAEEITGYRQDEVLGKTCDLFAADHCQDFYNDPEKRSRFGGERCSILTKNGQRRTISKNSETLYDEEGAEIGSIQSFEDVTLREADRLELKKYKEHLEVLVQERTTDLRRANEALHRQQQDLSQAKEAAEQVNRAKSSFLSVISHEIRTPLHGIVGFAELIDAAHPSPKIKELVNMILNESDHLGSLINTLLDHAKIEAGKLDLLMEPFDIHRVIHDLEPLMRSMIRSKNVEIQLHIAENFPQWILGDGMRITQVLINIASNAIKFTHEGVVRLSTRVLSAENGAYMLEFEVEDSGVGIPADKLDAVFESFTQADSRVSREYGGTGLGTTITRQLVKLMGGVVELTSTENVGTVFRVILPARAASEPALSIPEEKTGPAVPLRDGTLRGRVLVAEDNEYAQMLIRIHLESAGCTTDIAKDGREAVRLHAANEYDLVITDIHMPEMDGFETAKAIRAQENGDVHVPLLAMTANADVATRERCRSCGMDDVLTKPLRRRALLEVVNRWIAQGNQLIPYPEEEPITATADPPGIDSAVFSYETALHEFVGQRGMLLQVLKLFIQSSARQRRSMFSAFEAGDADTVRKIAHKLRGAAANMTASRLQHVAEKIESSLIRGDDLGSIEPFFEEWDDERIRFIDHLKTIPACAGMLTEGNSRANTHC